MIPLGTLVAVTISEPAESRSSLTVAIVAAVPADPCMRVAGDASVIDGAPLTFNVNVATVAALHSAPGAAPGTGS